MSAAAMTRESTPIGFRLLGAVVALVACLAWPALPARAQTAPAGNAHPDTHMVSEAEQIENPFGLPNVDLDARPTPEAKHAFAEAVNLEPLRDLAVFHNGRVKILDTLGREVVEYLAGRPDYFDLASGEKLGYDPLFTLFDLAIDPAYYLDRPLIHVNYLPLREAYLELAFPDDEQRRTLWKKLTRVSPLMVNDLSTPIFNAHAAEEPFRAGLQRTENARDLFQAAPGLFEVVAPESRSDRWHHLGELPGSHPARAAAAELAAAWRAQDAERVNAAVAALAAELPGINAELYPSSRRSLELTYNRSNAFEWGLWAYLGATVALVLAFGTGRRWLIGAGVALLVVAIGLHAFGFTLRCLVAERFAIQNQFESMTGVSLFAAIVGLGLMLWRRQWLFGAAAAATGFLILIFATQTDIPGQTIEKEAAILNTSVLLKYHVTTVLTSYGLITLGMIVSLFYLGTHYSSKLFGRQRLAVDVGAMSAVALAGPGAGTGFGSGGVDAAEQPRQQSVQRTLRDLDTAQMTILQLAFWTLGVGILLGAWWADHSWGRWWAFDPKETWALITWIVYLIVIHVRFATGKNKGLVTAWLSVVGFLIMLWTYFGVNLLLPGLHAYA